MAVVTDGLDRATLARWRAQLDALAVRIGMVEALPGGRETHFYAWCALGNVLVELEHACQFLDQARDELAEERGVA